ncbi:MAG: RICIN domain-containing protein [Paludibacteraceae bacterium]|nr:RICIN domain-containing protein [Paludibacteraceae bacterium]
MSSESAPDCFKKFYRYKNHGNGAYVQHTATTLTATLSTAHVVVKNTSISPYDWSYIWQVAPEVKYAGAKTLRSVEFPRNMIGKKGDGLLIKYYDALLLIRNTSSYEGDFDIVSALDGTNGISFKYHHAGNRYLCRKNGDTNLYFYSSSDTKNFKSNASYTPIQLQTAAVAYQETNYQTNYGSAATRSGFVVPLMLGSYTANNLVIYEVNALDWTDYENQITHIQSFRVAPGYKVTTYRNNNYTGAIAVYTSDQPNVSTSNVKSLKVELDAVGGKSGNYLIKNTATGQYMQLQSGNVTLQDYTGNADQQFTLQETATAGLYTITANNSQELAVKNSSREKGAQLSARTTENAQQFYLVRTENGSRYKLVPACTMGADTCKFLAKTTTDNIVRTAFEPYGDTKAYWELVPVETYRFTKKGGSRVASIIAPNVANRLVIYYPDGRVMRDITLGAGSGKISVDLRPDDCPVGTYTYQLFGSNPEQKLASVNVVY